MHVEPERSVETGRSDALAAADRYVFEREQKRLKQFDIPKHTRYTGPYPLTGSFAGTRTVEGNVLALVRRDDEILVIALKHSGVTKARRLAIGAPVVATSDGTVRTVGRSRR